MLYFCGCGCGCGGICDCAELGVDIGGATTTDIVALALVLVPLLLDALLVTLPDVLLAVAVAVAGRTTTALRLYSFASPADARRD
jgi:hypothetical protein